MSLLKWFGMTGGGAASDDNQLGAIEGALAAHGPDRARFLALFAYILTRVARADHQITDGEARVMERIIAGHAGIDDAQAALVVQIARAAGHSRGTDDFLITREFERTATREEKLAILDSLFEIAAADNSILTVEDNEVRRVASELKLEHADYIEVRQKYLHNLEVLRRNE